MKLRFLRERTLVNSYEVRHYAETYCVSIKEAQKLMCPDKEPRLQYYDDVAGDWVDVPTETVMVSYTSNEHPTPSR